MFLFGKKPENLSRRRVFPPGSTVGLPDDAFFRQEALSGLPTMRFFAREHFRGSRRCVFSSGSTFGNPDSAFFRQDALSGILGQTLAEHFHLLCPPVFARRAADVLLEDTVEVLGILEAQFVGNLGERFGCTRHQFLGLVY